MSTTKKPSRASRRAAPRGWMPSDTEIRKAVYADIQQFLTDSLTPDRGYAIPIANVKALIRRMTTNAPAVARKPPEAAGSASSSKGD